MRYAQTRAHARHEEEDHEQPRRQGTPGKVNRAHRDYGGALSHAAGFAAATRGDSVELPHRQRMEAAFGRDLSHVKAYVGAAAPLARMGAQAAAKGNEVAFAATNPGVQVVAHELAHVLQYEAGTTHAVNASGSGATSAVEREAEDVAARVASGGPAGPIGVGAGAEVYFDAGEVADIAATTLYKQRIGGPLPQKLGVLSDPVVIAGAFDGAYITDGAKLLNEYSSVFEEFVDMWETYDPDGLIVGIDTHLHHQARHRHWSDTFNETVSKIPTTEAYYGAWEVWLGGSYQRVKNVDEEGNETIALTADAEAEWDEYESDFLDEQDALDEAVGEAEDALLDFESGLQPDYDALADSVRDLASEEVKALEAKLATLLRETEAAHKTPVAKHQFELYVRHLEQAIDALRDIRDDKGLTTLEELSDVRAEIAERMEEGEGAHAIAEAVERGRNWVMNGCFLAWDELENKLYDDGIKSWDDTDEGRAFAKQYYNVLDELVPICEVPENPLFEDPTERAEQIHAIIDKMQTMLDDKYLELSPIGRATEIASSMLENISGLRARHEVLRSANQGKVEKLIGHQLVLDGLDELAKTAELGKEQAEKGYLHFPISRLEQAEKDLETLEARCMAEARRIFTSDKDEAKRILEDLVKQGVLTSSQVKAGMTQVDFGNKLGKYANLYEAIDEAVDQVIKADLPADKHTKLMTELAGFRTAIDASVQKEIKKVNAYIDAIDESVDKLKDLKGDIDKFTSPDFPKDDLIAGKPEGFEKLMFSSAWKLIGSDKLESKGFVKDLLKVRDGINKGLKGVGKLVKARDTIKTVVASAGALKNLNSEVSFEDGATHPFVEGLATCLEAGMLVSKVPAFDALVENYVKGLRAMSRTLAKLRQQRIKDRIDLIRLGNF